MSKAMGPPETGSPLAQDLVSCKILPPCNRTSRRVERQLCSAQEAECQTHQRFLTLFIPLSPKHLGCLISLQINQKWKPQGWQQSQGFSPHPLSRPEGPADDKVKTAVFWCPAPPTNPLLGSGPQLLCLPRRPRGDVSMCPAGSQRHKVP